MLSASGRCWLSVSLFFLFLYLYLKSSIVLSLGVHAWCMFVGWDQIINREYSFLGVLQVAAQSISTVLEL